MSLSKKVIIIITLVVFAAFSAGGTVLLATNSRAALAESVAQNSRRKQMSCYALESKLLADRLNGRKTDKTELARYADKMVAYATGEEIEIIDSNGQVIFSNLKGDAPVLRQNSYSVEKNENGYFNCFNATLSSYGTELNIIMRYDISYVFVERKRQYIAFLLIESAVLLCSGLAAFFITKRITRPLERLAQTANRISGGEYSLRTRIDSGDEIGSLSKSFDAMVAELEQQLENRTAFVADFSHELKTPMTSVIGYADILRTHVLDEHDKFMYADRIFKNAKRMENLSVKMLRMLKLSQTEPTLEPVESECIERGIRQMFENGENLDINSEKGIKILCDYDLLLTLLCNLIENAFRFSDGQKVIVKIEKSGNCCRFGVADSGRGMTQEEIRRAAEPFYKADKSRSAAGYGIGLSICKSICTLFKTELKFESELGRGTCVSFDLEVAE